MRSGFTRLLFAFIAPAWLTRLAGCATAHAGTGAALLVVKTAVMVAPPARLTATANRPVIFISATDLSRLLASDWQPMNVIATNRIQFTPDQAQLFIRGLAIFPCTNFPCVFSWNTVKNADRYRIYCGPASGVYNFIIETANRTQYTTQLPLAYATNYVAMTAIATNGFESVKSPEIIFQPQFTLNLQRIP